MDADTFVKRCDLLDPSARDAEVSRIARSHPEITTLIDKLQAGDVFSQTLALQLAVHSRNFSHILRAVVSSSHLVASAAASSTVRWVPEDADILRIVFELSFAVRCVLLKEIVRWKRTSLADKLAPVLLTKFGIAEITVLLPACSASIVSEILADAAYEKSCPWKKLTTAHPDVVLAHFIDGLKKTPAWLMESYFAGYRIAIEVLAKVRPKELVALLLEYFPQGSGNLSYLNESYNFLNKGAHDGLYEFMTRTLTLQSFRHSYPSSLAKCLTTFADSELQFLGKAAYTSGAQTLVNLLQNITKRQRAVVWAAITPSDKVYSSSIIGLLSPPQRYEEAARVCKIRVVAENPDSRRTFLAYCDYPTVVDELKKDSTLPSEDTRLAAYVALVQSASAGAEANFVDMLSYVIPRLARDRDPIRSQVVNLLGSVPISCWTAAACPRLNEIVDHTLRNTDSSSGLKHAVVNLCGKVMVNVATLAFHHAKKLPAEDRVKLVSTVVSDARWTAASSALSRMVLSEPASLCAWSNFARFGSLPVEMTPTISDMLLTFYDKAKQAAGVAAVKAEEDEEYSNKMDSVDGTLLNIVQALGHHAFTQEKIMSLLGEMVLRRPLDRMYTQDAATLWMSDGTTRTGRTQQFIAAHPKQALNLPGVAFELMKNQHTMLTAVLHEGPDSQEMDFLPLNSLLYKLSPSLQKIYVDKWLSPAVKNEGSNFYLRMMAMFQWARMTCSHFSDLLAACNLTIPAPDAEPPKKEDMKETDMQKASLEEQLLKAISETDSPIDSLPLLRYHLRTDNARTAIRGLKHILSRAPPALLFSEFTSLMANIAKYRVVARKDVARLALVLRLPGAIEMIAALVISDPPPHRDLVRVCVEVAIDNLGSTHAWTILKHAALHTDADIAVSVLAGIHQMLPRHRIQFFRENIFPVLSHPEIRAVKMALAQCNMWLPELAKSSTKETPLPIFVEAVQKIADMFADLDFSGNQSEMQCLVYISDHEPSSPIILAALAKLVKLAEIELEQPVPLRDLPARQRIIAFVSRLASQTATKRWASRNLIASVMDMLAKDLTYYKQTLSLRLCLVPWTETENAVAHLTAIAKHAETISLMFVPRMLESFTTTVNGLAINDDQLVLLAKTLLSDASSQAVVAARLMALAIVVRAGTRLSWNEETRGLLLQLRKDASLDVKYAALQVFTNSG